MPSWYLVPDVGKEWLRSDPRPSGGILRGPTAPGYRPGLPECQKCRYRSWNAWECQNCSNVREGLPNGAIRSRRPRRPRRYQLAVIRAARTYRTFVREQHQPCLTFSRMSATVLVHE